MIRRLHRVKVLRVERAEKAIKTQQACLQAAHRRHQEAVQTSQDYHCGVLMRSNVYLISEKTPH